MQFSNCTTRGPLFHDLYESCQAILFTVRICSIVLDKDGGNKGRNKSFKRHEASASHKEAIMHLHEG